MNDQDINNVIEKVAYRVSRDTGHDPADLIQQGWLNYLEMQHMLDDSLDEKQIYKYLYSSIHGYLLNHVYRSTDALDTPNLISFDQMNDDNEYEDGMERITEHAHYTMPVNNDTPYDAYVRMEQELVCDQKLDELRASLTEKQQMVFDNMMLANPLTQRELAGKMDVSQQSVSKLTRKVFKKAKAMAKEAYSVRDI